MADTARMPPADDAVTPALATQLAACSVAGGALPRLRRQIGGHPRHGRPGAADTPRAPPVAAGALRCGRPAPDEVPDFGDGGAYPDVHVIQYPLQMGAGKLGPGGIAPRLDIDYAQLQVNTAHRAPRSRHELPR
jgi:hypothetical protein